MDNRPLVLIADDQPEFSRLVTLSLEREGFRVASAPDGLSAIDRVSELNPDLLLLDIGMPGMSGLDVLREIRDTHAMPVIFISGQSTASAMTTGLDQGADDYIAKPFHPTELAARIRAVLRRRRRMVGGRRRIGAALVDLDGRTVTRDGQPVRIGRVEWLLLEHLLTNEGRIVLHEELLTHVWGPEYRDDIPYLRLWIGQLRRHLGIPAWEEGAIRTIQGMGYAYDPDETIPTMRSRRPRSPVPQPRRTRASDSDSEAPEAAPGDDLSARGGSSRSSGGGTPVPTRERRTSA
jgi:two-component system KDP operon response regulator KdpE